MKDLPLSPIAKAVTTRIVTSENVNRYNDAFAKFILTDPGKDVLADFLNAIFEDEPCPAVEGKIVAVEFSDREMTAQSLGNKVCRLDLLVTTDRGQPIDIEIQCYDDPFLETRSLAYWAELAGRMLRRGKDYGEYKPAVIVTLVKLGHPMFGGGEGWHAVVEARLRKTKRLFSKMLNLHFVQPEICPTISEKNKKRIHWWVDYFEHRHVDELKKFAEHDGVFGRIMKSEEKFLADMDKQVQYACIERDIRDRFSLENLRYNQGIAEGEAKKTRDIVFRMFEGGMPIEQICGFVGLSCEETEAILQQ